MSPFTVQSIVRGLSLGPFAVVGASIDYHIQEINPCLLQSQFYECSISKGVQHPIKHFNK